MEVSALLDDLRERLRPLRSGMFPQQVVLELTDDHLLGQPLVKGRPGPPCIDVPLPSLTCREGLPVDIDPLADLIGDLLMREGKLDAYVLASLPRSAVEWRVIDWGEEPPEDGAAQLRERKVDLGLAYPLEEATLDLRPLAGAPGKQLLAATRREVVEGWIQVFRNAGTHLDRLACPQACRLGALQPTLATMAADTLVVVLNLGKTGGDLLAIREGVPLFEWPLPVGKGALVKEVERCVAFLRKEFAGITAVRLLVEGAPETAPEGAPEAAAELEAALGLPVERIAPEPYGSLVLQGLAIPEALP